MSNNTTALSADGYSIMAAERDGRLQVSVKYHNSSRNLVILEVTEKEVRVREAGEKDSN